MGRDDGWRYQDPHQWGPGMHHHGPPPWIDGPDAGWSILPALFPLLMVLWIIYRWYAIDLFAERARVVRAARAARRDTVRARWDAAVARYAQTAQAYAAFECDATAVLHRPALADVTEPATSRFVDAFAEATALATDAYPGAEAGERFVAAAERADRAWQAAVDRVRAAGGGGDGGGPAAGRTAGRVTAPGLR